MPHPSVLPDLTSNRWDRMPAVFSCRWMDGGLESAWVHPAGELDMATAPLLGQTLRRAELCA